MIRRWWWKVEDWYEYGHVSTYEKRTESTCSVVSSTIVVPSIYFHPYMLLNKCL